MQRRQAETIGAFCSGPRRTKAGGMTDPTSSRPSVRLKPKADARRIRHGHPWVFDNDLVTDRRTRALAPGAFAVLEDAGRNALALVAVNPKSRIIARVLDADPGAHLDQDWFASKVKAALKLRERLFDEPFYRLVHAEADGLPGVVIDRFGDLVVIQPNAAWAETHVDALAGAVAQVTGVTSVLKNASGRARQLEGLDDSFAVLQGQTPTEPIQVPMNGAVYFADVTGGQKTGLFFDQRPNHAMAARMAHGARVLDVFSHVGGFALAALAGGAASAISVDGSKPALDLAQQGAEIAGFGDRFGIRQGDAFTVMTALQDEDERFDMVVCDPPAFAPSKSALSNGLRAYEKTARLAAPLVAPGGTLVLCSCSHAATLDKFLNACTRGIGRAGRTARLLHTGFAGPDHPQLPQLGESGYLKALFFAL